MQRLFTLLALLVVAPVGAASEARNHDPGPSPAPHASQGLFDDVWPPPGNPCRPTCAQDTE